MNEYDYTDSFIDDSQLSDTNTPYHMNNVQCNSPLVHNVGKTKRRRRAYLLDSDTDATPQCDGGHVTELMLHNDDDDDCNDISYGKPSCSMNFARDKIFMRKVPFVKYI